MKSKLTTAQAVTYAITYVATLEATLFVEKLRAENGSNNQKVIVLAIEKEIKRCTNSLVAVGIIIPT